MRALLHGDLIAVHTPEGPGRRIRPCTIQLATQYGESDAVDLTLQPCHGRRCQCALRISSRPLLFRYNDIPNPAAPRYCNTGQPSPPAPTTMTFAFFNLIWAFRIRLASIWRQVSVETYPPDQSHLVSSAFHNACSLKARAEAPSFEEWDKGRNLQSTRHDHDYTVLFL